MADVKDKHANDATAHQKHKVVAVPRPTPDQLAFLKKINLRPGQYDRSVVVGGPSRVRKPSA